MGLLSVLSPVSNLVGKGSDHTQPIIDQLQSQVDALINGTKTTAQITDAQVAQLLKDRPDIATEYARASSTADKNSPVYKQKGLDSVQNYAKYWYTQMGGNKAYTFPDQTSAQPSPTDVAKTITDNATSTTDKALTDLSTTTTSLVDQLKAQSTSLTGVINNQATAFANSQAELLAGFQKAQADSAKQMADLVSQMNSVGQAAKKPNYAAALAKNKQLNGGGLGSTALTGAGGVTPGASNLGFTSLLGA